MPARPDQIRSQLRSLSRKREANRNYGNKTRMRQVVGGAVAKTGNLIYRVMAEAKSFRLLCGAERTRS